MNKDQSCNLTLKERFELIISNRAIERELQKVKKAAIIVETIKCHPVDNKKNEDDPCMNSLIYESV